MIKIRGPIHSCTKKSDSWKTPFYKVMLIINRQMQCISWHGDCHTRSAYAIQICFEGVCCTKLSFRFNFFIFVLSTTSTSLVSESEGENELSTYVTSIVIYPRWEFSTIGTNYQTSCTLFDMQLSVPSIVTCPRWDISTITESSFVGRGCFQGSPSILIYTWSVVPWWNSNRTLCACASRVPWPCGASKNKSMPTISETNYFKPPVIYKWGC